MTLDERERGIWDKLEGGRDADGVPQAACSAMTPVSIWVVVATIVIFIPAALILAFFVGRHTIVVQAGEIVVLDVGFFTGRLREERQRRRLGAGGVELNRSKLSIDGQRYWVDPGFGDSARKIVELASGGD